MGQSNRLSLSRQKKGKSCRTIEPFSKVEIAAHDEILLTAKGSYTKINGKGIEHGTPKAFTWYTPTLGMPGPKNLAMSFNEMPQSKFDQELFLMLPNGNPAKNIRFEIHREEGSVIKGVTDASGNTKIQKSDSWGKYEVRLLGKAK